MTSKKRRCIKANSMRERFWFLTERKGFDHELPINSLGISISLREVYDRLKFAEEK